MEIELVGWIATFFVILSFLFDGIKLRVLSLVGCVLWMYYGYVTGGNSIMYLNLTLSVINVVKIHQLSKLRSN